MIWEKDPARSHVKRYVPLFVVMAAMAVLIAVGYSIHPHPDETVFVADAKHWDHKPVTVSWDRDYYGPWNGAIVDAIRITNQRLGCEVLREAFKDADVTIKSDDGTACGGNVVDVDKPASTYYCARGPVIVTRRLGDYREAGRLFQHELGGHALYLADDTAAVGGVMSPLVFEENAYPEYWNLNEADAKALSARYCK